MSGLLSVQDLAQSLATDLLARQLGFGVRLDPPEDPASIGVALAQAYLSQGGTCMRPEIFTPKPDSTYHGLLINGVRFQSPAIPSTPLDDGGANEIAHAI